MAGFYPVPATRTTGLLEQTRLLSQLHSQQIEIQRLQNQVSSGRRLSAPSDDVAAAQRGQTIQRILELKAQSQTNLRSAQSYLDATDSALADVASILSHVRGLAVEANSDTTTESARAAIAAEVRAAIEQLLRAGNQTFRDRYLFAGSRAASLPFRWEASGIVYHGNEGSLPSFVDLDLPYATNASGADVFGTYSQQVQGTVDLNPILTAQTPLADLYGGRGVQLGSLIISDGTNKQVIDLSSAATIGDVAALIEAKPPAGRTVTVQITPTGLIVDIDDAGGGNFTIREVPGGTTARDLRIESPFSTGTSPVIGGDLNPRLRLTTPLADIVPGGQPLDLAAGLQITNAGQTYVIDTSTAQTVEDLLNAINHSGTGVIAEIASGGDRLTVRSRTSGADFAIGENGGSLATQLGIRSLTEDTLLGELNYGAGVGFVSGSDFIIRRKDGVELAIDVSSAATIGDVLDLINNDLNNLDPATRVLARLAPFGNGIELFDGNTAGTGQLAVLRQFQSTAAWDLGLIPRGADSAVAVTSPAGDTLAAADSNPQEVSGIFNSLLRLHDALVNFDRGRLERAMGLLDQDFDRLNFARGEIGIRSRTLERIASQLEDETVQLQSNLSDDLDTDLAHAISTLTARQAALEASLRLTASVFRLSLLDFL